MPGDFGGNARQEPGHLGQLVIAVVERRHHQGHDLQPKAHLLDALDALQHVGQRPAQLAVVPVVEALQIDLVQIHQRTDERQHFGGGVPVGYEPAHNAALASRREDLHRPIRSDQRLVVGADHHRGMVAEGQFGEFLRLDPLGPGDGIVISQALAGNPVLAVAAVEIAPQHAEGQGVPARKGVEEGLLLDRVHLHARDIAGGHVQLAIADVPDPAHPPLAFGDLAPMAAGQAANRPFVLAADQLLGRRHGQLLKGLFESRHKPPVRPSPDTL